ncbi:unnamed protein product [Trichobilharzia regenti]|nr:unnamed protein product [Trichobilharzia regenti]
MKVVILPLNYYLLIVVVSLCAQPSSQHIQQHQLPTQQYVVPIHIASQTPGKITSNVITLNSGNNKDLGYRRGVNRLIGKVSFISQSNRFEDIDNFIVYAFIPKFEINFLPLFGIQEKIVMLRSNCNTMHHHQYWKSLR